MSVLVKITTTIKDFPPGCPVALARCKPTLVTHHGADINSIDTTMEVEREHYEKFRFKTPSSDKVTEVWVHGDKEYVNLIAEMVDVQAAGWTQLLIKRIEAATSESHQPKKTWQEVIFALLFPTRAQNTRLRQLLWTVQSMLRDEHIRACVRLAPPSPYSKEVEK